MAIKHALLSTLLALSLASEAEAITSSAQKPLLVYKIEKAELPVSIKEIYSSSQPQDNHSLRTPVTACLLSLAGACVYMHVRRKKSI